MFYIAITEQYNEYSKRKKEKTNTILVEQTLESAKLRLATWCLDRWSDDIDYAPPTNVDKIISEYFYDSEDSYVIFDPEEVVMSQERADNSFCSTLHNVYRESYEPPFDVGYPFRAKPCPICKVLLPPPIDSIFCLSCAMLYDLDSLNNYIITNKYTMPSEKKHITHDEMADVEELHGEQHHIEISCCPSCRECGQTIKVVQK